jgi:FKBP-type peptidyl-prolyl cis-trans isomerase FkpA
VLRVFNSTARFVLVTALVLLAGACSESVTGPSGSAPFTQTDIRLGSGAAAANGNVVTVHYTGWLYDEGKTEGKGTQFETSRSGDPFPFTLGAGQVIPGWDQGVAGMRVGGLRRLTIPPSLAYGSSRNGPIPPNATLVFEIEVFAIQ